MQLKTEWVLVKDDPVHWHYEKVEREYCCDLVHLQRVCLDCEDHPAWHAALRCPVCRGPGVEKGKAVA